MHIATNSSSSFPRDFVLFCLLLFVPVVQIKTPNSTSLCRSIPRTWKRSPSFWLYLECQQTEWSSSLLHRFMSQPGRKSAFWKVALMHKFSSPSFIIRQTIFRLRAHRDHDGFFTHVSGCPLNRHNSVAGVYAQACVQAAGQCGADVLDLWTLMQKDGQVSCAHHCCVLCSLEATMTCHAHTSQRVTLFKEKTQEYPRTFLERS